MPTTSGLPQPAELPRTRPQTIPSAPPVTSARPGRSSGRRGPKLSSSRVSTSGITASPIGTLSQKIHSQARPSVIAPPTTGPPSTARPVTALNRPIALPRCSGGNAGGQQRERERHHERRAGALHGAGGDQRADAGSEGTRSRGRGEQADAGGEHPPAAEAVAEQRAGHQQDGEAQGVAVDRPFELLDRGAEVDPDRAQRGRDHERVERHHQRGDGGEGEYPAA